MVRLSSGFPLSRAWLGLAAVLAITGPAERAAAQAVAFAEEEQADGWRFLITPYLFLPVTTTGTSTVAGGSVDVDLDLRDVLDALNFAASARGEVWKGRFGLITDVYYVALGGDGSIETPGPLPGTIGIDLDVRQFWASLLGAYRVVEGSYEQNGAKRRYAFDAGVGVRYNRLKQEIDADLNLDIGEGVGFQRTLGGTEDWFEPTFTLRGGAEVSERWTLGVRADIGGFGAGGDDFQWTVVAGADYRPWTNTSLKFGWQFYGIDYSTDRADGEFAYDVFQTGPYLAATFRF
jgi:hypothetical protein